MNINGWNTIQSILKRTKKNQSYLAEKLGMTPAAITQIKNGEFKLKEFRFQKICEVLGATQKEKKELLTEVVNARFFGRKEIEIR